MDDDFLKHHLRRIDAAIARARAARLSSDQARHRRSDIRPVSDHGKGGKPYTPRPRQPRQAVPRRSRSLEPPE